MRRPGSRDRVEFEGSSADRGYSLTTRTLAVSDRAFRSKHAKSHSRPVCLDVRTRS